MMKLTRTRVGDFILDDTLTLNQISALVLKGEIEQRMVSVDNIFKDYPEITFAEEIDRYLHNGNKISGDNIPDDIQAVDNVVTQRPDISSFRTVNCYCNCFLLIRQVNIINS